MASTANDMIEDIVIRRIAAILGAESIRVDDGSKDGQHDFDLVLPSGRRIAVEITGEVSSEALRAAAATRKHRLQESGVSHVWDVSMTDFNANRKRLAQKLPALLVEFEGSGRGSVSADNEPRLAELGIERADSIEGEGAGIYLTSVDASAAGPIDVVDSLNDHARRADNMNKLGRAESDERHLAVWFDMTAGMLTQR